VSEQTTTQQDLLPQNTVHGAHDAYVEAINMIRTDRTCFRRVVTEDVVFLPSGADPIQGVDAVEAWIEACIGFVCKRWTRDVREVKTTGDLAYEWYSFQCVDESTNGSEFVAASGHGVCVYTRSNDGHWRVARDIWSNGYEAEFGNQ
jgi:ketosteroid isomerase-like protein